MNTKSSRFKTFSLLASLYFCEGLPFAIVVAMPVVYLKNCGVDNAFITFWTNILALPWTLKGLWAPTLDGISNFRPWIIKSQLICTLLCLALCLANYSQVDYRIMLALFGIMGYVAATQDLAIDAHYLAVFSSSEQSKLMWLRNTAFRIAYLLGAGIFISLAGVATESHWLNSSNTGGWTVVFALCAALIVSAAIYNNRVMRKGYSSMPQIARTRETSGLLAAVRSMLRLPGIWQIATYTLVFRIGDAFLSAIAQPFLLDSIAAGGLGLKTSTVGFIYGTFGAISLIAGGVVGGIFISRFGARKLLVPFSLLQSLSILGYYFLAQAHPPVVAVCAVNAFEQICFGLTTSCYSVVLLTAVDPRFRATHFAIICAIMNLGLIVPGMFSGSISDKLGYGSFFLVSFVLSLIGPLVSLLLPPHDLLDGKTSSEKSLPSARVVLNSQQTL